MFRRIAAAAAVVSTLAVNPAFAASQQIADIIDLDWAGVSVQPADFTESGKAYLKQYLDIHVDGSDHVWGTARTTITLDGQTYAGEYRVSGSFDGKDGLTLSSSATRTDTLPNGLRWCDGTMHLTIYRDQGRDGHYLLQGTSDDSCGGRSQLEYSDR